MNKTVTVNISGIVFHIEEDAYEKLGAYLAAIRSHFRQSNGSDEIMADIEARIAELFRERNTAGKEVLIMADVDYVISIMGRPEDFADGQPEADQDDTTQAAGAGSSQQTGGSFMRRRLYRDPDNRVVGGLCAGLGHYFGIDPVWLRIAWAVLIFAFGIGFLFYVLMLIIVPKAETTAEKLEMRGEPVNVENIGRTVKEEFSQFGKRMENAGRQFGENARRWSYEQRDNWQRSRTGDRVSDFFHQFFRVVGRIFGGLIIVLGLCVLFGIFTSVLGFSNFGPDEFTGLLHHLFTSETQYTLAIIALLLVFGIPCVMLIFGGIRLLFNLRGRHRLISIIAFCTWVVGLAIGISVFVSVGTQFNESGETDQALTLPAAHAALMTVKVNIEPDMDINGGVHYRHWYSGGGFRDRTRMLSVDGKRIRFGYPHLHIVPAPADSFQVIVYRQSQGASKHEAQQLAHDILYQATVKDSTLELGSYFEIGSGTRWRNQEVNIELRVPVNHMIFIDRTTTDLLDDIQNVSDSHDSRMGDRRWMMTPKGLACVDCGGLEISPGESAAEIMALVPAPAVPKVPADTAPASKKEKTK